MRKKHKIALLIGVSLIALVLVTRDTPREKEAKYLRRGNELFDKGEYKKARLEYKNASRIMPVDPEIAYRWGLVDEAEGDVRSAFLYFSQAEQQNPHYHPALLKIAHYQLVIDNIDEVQKRVDTVLADKPDDPEAHAMLGALLLRKKDFAGTEKEALFALGKDPANITATSVLAGLYLAKGDIAKASDTVDQSIVHNPSDLSLLTLKVRIYEKPLNLPKIDEAYQAIFKLKPTESQFRIYLSNTYLEAHKIDEAEAVLRSGVAALPEDWNFKHQLVTFLNNNRGFEVAEKEIRGYMQAYPENDDLLFWLADLYLTHNDIDKAVTLLEQIVSKDQKDKQSLNARTSLARINFVKGNKEQAERLVEAVLKKVPYNREALYIRANIAADQGLYQNAVTDLRIIIRDQPQAKDALQLLSEILLLQGYTDLAIETLNRLIDVDPANSALRVRLAQMYNLNGDPQRALKLLAMVTKTDPNYAIGWENTARVAIGIKDFETAKMAIHNLDALDGQHMTATFLEGQILANGGKYEDARASYVKIIDADPSSSLAEHALYAMATAQQTPQELEKTTQYIASLKTDNAYVNTILGECYLQLGKTDPAAASFDKAIANNPTNQDPYLHRAMIYMNAKKTDDAFAVLKKAVATVPGDVRAPIAQADILRELGRFEEAIALYEDILKNNPGSDMAANNMASIIADHFYTDPVMLEKAGKVAEQFAGTSVSFQLDTLGWIYYRQGKLDQALKILARAVAADSKTSPELHYHYGAALLKANKIAEAKSELLLAVTEGVNYPDLETAKKLLKKVQEDNNSH